MRKLLPHIRKKYENRVSEMSQGSNTICDSGSIQYMESRVSQQKSVRKKKPPHKKTKANNVTDVRYYFIIFCLERHNLNRCIFSWQPDEINCAALGQNSDSEIEQIKSPGTRKRKKDAAGYDNVLNYLSEAYHTKEEVSFFLCIFSTIVQLSSD